MQIILKRKVQFMKYEQYSFVDKVGDKHTLNRVVDRVTIEPSNSIQTAPDWISDDKHFELLEADKLLIQVSVVNSSPAKNSDSNESPVATGDDTSKQKGKTTKTAETTPTNFGGFGLSSTEGKN